MEIKRRLKNIGVGVVKNGCGHLCPKTLKLAVSVTEETDFFYGDANSGKLKVTVIIIGWGWPFRSL